VQEDDITVVTFPTVRIEHTDHFDQATEAHYVPSNSRC
jgi:hypothetical protein